MIFHPLEKWSNIDSTLWMNIPFTDETFKNYSFYNISVFQDCGLSKLYVAVRRIRENCLVLSLLRQ